MAARSSDVGCTVQGGGTSLAPPDTPCTLAADAALTKHLQTLLTWLLAVFRWLLGGAVIADAAGAPPLELVQPVPPASELAQPVPTASKPVQPVPPEDGAPAEILLEHTAESFSDAVRRRLGRGEIVARALYRDFFVDGVLTARAAEVKAAASTLAGPLLGLCEALPPLTAPATAVPPLPGETDKYVLTTADGYEIEMVAMPAPGVEASWSLCLSTQVGCRMGCTFCETGRMGLLRNLSVGEIVGQLAFARFELGLAVSSIVFMGMGERLLGLEP